MDIIQRLRLTWAHDTPHETPPDHPIRLCQEAADLINALRYDLGRIVMLLAKRLRNVPFREGQTIHEDHPIHLCELAADEIDRLEAEVMTLRKEASDRDARCYRCEFQYGSAAPVGLQERPEPLPFDEKKYLTWRIECLERALHKSQANEAVMLAHYTPGRQG